MIVFLLEAIVGSLAYVYESQVKSELNETLNDTFLQNYAIDFKQTNAIDHMQQTVWKYFNNNNIFNLWIIINIILFIV